jgi:phage terminase Nu1 subunit (DNA packaging protein)
MPTDPVTPITQAQAAVLAGLSLRHFQRLMAEPGAPPKIQTTTGRAAGLPVEPYRRWLRGRIAAELGAAETLSPQAERARLDRARAELAELDLGRKRLELIPKNEVAAAWSSQIHIAKSRLLSLPSRVSGEILRLRTQREIEGVIRDRIIEILDELSRQASETPSN